VSYILQLMLILVVILFTAKYAGYFSVRIGQPAVFGKIALGLLLGPTLFDIVNWHIGSFYIFGGLDHAAHEAVAALPFVQQVAHAVDEGQQTGGLVLMNTIHSLAELGVLFLMFMAGLETDLKQMMRVGKVALYAAIGGVAGPFFFGAGAGYGFQLLGLSFNLYECIFIGTILTATSVSISAQTLMELGRLKSKEGTTILGAAVIDDVVGIIVLSVVIALKPQSTGAHGAEGAAGVHAERLLDWIMMGLGDIGWLRIVLLIIMMVAFFVVGWFAEKWLVRPLVNRFERMPVTEGLLAGVLLVGLLYAWAAEWIGNVAAITGTYLCGVLLGRTDMRHEIEEKLHTITYSFFVPIFFVNIGLHANARPIFEPLAHMTSMTRTEWLVLIFTLLISAIAVFTKVWGCQIGAAVGGFNKSESLRVGVGMISRGEVGIIVALVGLNAGIIDSEVFSMMILMVLVTTLVTPLWLKLVFKKGQGESGSETGEAPA
jgi:Kef-type K+ transport system membrane component KefB